LVTGSAAARPGPHEARHIEHLAGSVPRPPAAPVEDASEGRAEADRREGQPHRTAGRGEPQEPEVERAAADDRGWEAEDRRNQEELRLALRGTPAGTVDEVDEEEEGVDEHPGGSALVQTASQV
jgi:hypothetical protein